MVALVAALALCHSLALGGAPARPSLPIIPTRAALLALPAFHAPGTQVIHFWATWCGPCREELPAFVARAKALSARGVHFTFVSVDDPAQLDSRVLPFLRDVGALFPGATHVLLSPSVDPDSLKSLAPGWSAAVPQTLVFRHGERVGFAHGEDDLHALDGLGGPRPATKLRPGPSPAPRSPAPAPRPSR